MIVSLFALRFVKVNVVVSPSPLNVSLVTSSKIIAKGGADYFLAKGVSIPPNSAIELIQGGAKIVLENGDVLKAKSDTASSLDIVTSFIDTISS